MRAPHVISGTGKGHLVGVLLHVLSNSVYLVECFLHCRRTSDASVNPNREKDGVHPAFFHTRNVDVTVRVALPEIELLCEEALSRVIVGVEDDRRELQFRSAIGDVVSVQMWLESCRRDQSYGSRKG